MGKTSREWRYELSCMLWDSEDSSFYIGLGTWKNSELLLMGATEAKFSIYSKLPETYSNIKLEPNLTIFTLEYLLCGCKIENLAAGVLIIELL